MATFTFNIEHQPFKIEVSEYDGSYEGDHKFIYIYDVPVNTNVTIKLKLISGDNITGNSTSPTNDSGSSYIIASGVGGTQSVPPKYGVDMLNEEQFYDKQYILPDGFSEGLNTFHRLDYENSVPLGSNSVVRFEITTVDQLPGPNPSFVDIALVRGANNVGTNNVSVCVVDNCLDDSGINNTNIFYNNNSIQNGSIIYTDSNKTIPFAGNNLTYIFNAQIETGNVDLNSVPKSNYICNINNSGVVSNITSC